MEINALVLAVVVISVALTTFVCSVLGKYCAAKYLIPLDYYRYRSRRSRISHYRRARRHCQCNVRPRNIAEEEENDTFVVNLTHANAKQPREKVVNDNAGDLRQSCGNKLEITKKSDQNVALSVTFDRLGIRSDKAHHHVELDPCLNLNLPDGSTSGDNQINLNMIPQPRNNQRQVLRQKSNYGREESFLMEGTNHDYEEISRFKNTIRDPGDGEPRNESDNVAADKLRNGLHHLKPGSTGQKPFPKTYAFVTDINIDDLADNEKTYMKLGIDKNEEGDRLTPIVQLLEEDRGSSNENSTSFKEELIQNFENSSQQNTEAIKMMMSQTNAPILAQKLEDYILKTETTCKESEFDLEEQKSLKSISSSAIHEKNFEEKSNENTSIAAEPSITDVEETVVDISVQQGGCISSKSSSLTSKSTQNQAAQMTEEDEVFSGDLCEADQKAASRPFNKRLTRIARPHHCSTCSCESSGVCSSLPNSSALRSLSHRDGQTPPRRSCIQNCSKKSYHDGPGSEEKFEQLAEERNSFPSLKGGFNQNRGPPGSIV